MTHRIFDDEVGYYASHYALGALSQHEVRAVEEHVAEGCDVCVQALEDFKSVVDCLAHSAPERTPPADLRDRLLARIAATQSQTRGDAEAGDAARAVEVAGAAESSAESEILVLRADESEWQKTWDERVLTKVLYVDKESGLATTLYKMLPGARVPRHRHTSVEQCLVLQGDLRSDGVTFSAGDYICAPVNTIHEELTTEQGNLLLVVAPESFEVLEPESRQDA